MGRIDKALFVYSLLYMKKFALSKEFCFFKELFIILKTYSHFGIVVYE